MRTTHSLCAWRLTRTTHSLCAWAGWDPELLALELQKPEPAKYDLGLTGFDTPELDELLKSEPTIVDTAEAAPESPVSRAGDLWRLGPHRLPCGDATSSQTVARLLSERHVRLLVTEPPQDTRQSDTLTRRIASPRKRTIPP
jgi:hypothetical protein